MQTTKIISLDFNLDYHEFKEILLRLILAKAGETYDPMNFDSASLSLKYSIIPTARVATLSKNPLHLSDYCDFDDDLDYDVLQGEIRNLLSQGRRSSDHLGKNTLTMHATLIKSSDSPCQRVNEKALATPTAPPIQQRVVSFLKLYITDKNADRNHQTARGIGQIFMQRIRLGLRESAKEMDMRTTHPNLLLPRSTCFRQSAACLV